MQRLSSRGARLWAAAQRAYAEACSTLPPALSAQMVGAVSLLHASSRSPSELRLAVRLAAGGDGAELRFQHYHALGWDGRAWRLGVCWRPLPAPPNGAKTSRGWRPLALACIEDPPLTGLEHVDREMEEAEELEVYDTSGLTADAVAALRIAVRSANEPPEERAALSDVAFLTLALTACGALGLEAQSSGCNIVTGHTWPPPAQAGFDDSGCSDSEGDGDAKDGDNAVADDARPDIAHTGWLEHALRAACGAPSDTDAQYRGFDGAAVKTAWGKEVLALCFDDCDEEGNLFEGVEQRGGVPPEALWEYVEQHGCLPWDDGSTSPLLEMTFMTMPRVPPPPDGASAEKVAAHKALVAQKEAEVCARLHAGQCEVRKKERRRWKQRVWPGPGGPGGDELPL